MHVSAFKYYLPSLNHAEFDKNSVILSNLQLEQTVKVTAMLICTQNKSRQTSTLAPSTLINIISLLGS